MAKEGPGFADPRQTGEFIDSGDQERRQTAIDGLVDGQYREWPVAAKIARRVGTADLEIGWRMLVRHASEGGRRKFGTAPWAGLERRRRAFIAPVPIAPHTAHGSR